MKLFVRGNTAVVKSAIKVEDYEKYKSFGVFNAKDEDGNVSYVLKKGRLGSINSFSFEANSEYQGCLALSMAFQDMTAEEFTFAIKPKLVALKQAEEYMLASMEETNAMLASVDEDITVE